MNNKQRHVIYRYPKDRNKTVEEKLYENEFSEEFSEENRQLQLERQQKNSFTKKSKQNNKQKGCK